MKNLEQIIDQWIGEEREIKLGSVLDYSLDNSHSYGYNQALQDLKSRKQELIEGIVGIVEEAFKTEIFDDIKQGLYLLDKDGVIKMLTGK